MSDTIERPPPAAAKYPDLNVPDPTDCSPGRPGLLSDEDRALLILGDEGPFAGSD